MSTRDDDINAGIRIGLDYAAGFLDGAATAARLIGLETFSGALASAGAELRGTNPTDVKR